MESYRAKRAISGTDTSRAVKDFEAWAFERRMKNEGTTPPWLGDDSAAMAFGTLVHCALLEPQKFEAKAVIMPYVENFALKAGRDIKAEALALAELKNGFIVKQQDAWAIGIMRRNFAAAVAEFPGQWRTEVTLYKDDLKGMVDAITPDFCIDLKTTRDIARTDATIHFERYGIQLYHYAHLAERERTAFIFVENIPPFRVKVEHVSDEQFQANGEAWRMVVEKIREQDLV